MQAVTGGGVRVTRIFVAMTAVAALALSIVIPINAALADPLTFYEAVQSEPFGRPQEPADPASSPLPEPDPVVHDDVVELRSLPLLPDDSIVRETFKTLDDTQDVALVAKISRLLAEKAGIPGSVQEELDWLLESADTPYGQVEPPFKFPALEALLSDFLAQDEAAAHSAELLEFASFMTLRAAWETSEHAHVSHIVLQALPDSCDRDLSQSHLATVGWWGSNEEASPFVKKALTSCPDDPTPKLLYGMWLANHSTITHTIADWTATWDAGINYFKEWRDSDPSSSLARAGLAHAMLRIVFIAEKDGTLPLTAHELLSPARRSIDEAIQRFPHASYYATAAVLAQLSADTEAADHYLQLADKSIPAQYAHSFIQHERGNFEQVGDLTPRRNEIDVLQINFARTWFTSLLPHSADAMQALLSDPTAPDGIGGDILSWFGVFPEYDYAGDGLFEDPLEWHFWNEVLAGNHRGNFDIPDGYEAPYEDYSEHSPLLKILGTAPGSPMEPSTYEAWQNYLRMGGEFRMAEEVVKTWLFNYENDPIAYKMHAEILFQCKDYLGALDALEDAITVTRQNAASDDSFSDGQLTELEIMTAVVLGQIPERTDESASAFRAAADAMRDGRVCGSYQGEDAYVLLRLAEGAAQHGDERTAISLFEDAISCYDSPPRFTAEAPVLKGLVHHNYATWLVEWGNDPNLAVEQATEAIAYDPLSPVFWDTLGQSHQQAGNPTAAEEAYMMSTSGGTDPTVTTDGTGASDAESSEVTMEESPSQNSVTPFQSLNNLAILKFDRGDRDGAANALAAAIKEKPDYAIGWWNLGVLESGSPDPAHFNRAEGALSRAALIDSSLRGKALELIIDYEIYDANLDLSRTVDESWSIGGGSRPVGKQLSWVAVALAGLAVAGNLLREQTTARVSEWLLARRKSKALFIPILIYGALLSGLVVYTIESSASGWIAGGLVSLALLAIVTLYTLLAGPLAQVRGWTPAVALSIVLVALRIPFLPAPVVHDPEVAFRRWPGVVVFAGTAAAGLLLSVATGSPTSRLIGVSALALTASAMLPVPPFDGAAMKHRALKLTSTVALLGTAVAASMAWI